MTQSKHNKRIVIDDRAKKELNEFSRVVRIKFRAAFELLEKNGYLHEPFAKKLTDNLFEIRIKHLGQWRSVYSYLKQDVIIILLAFHKTTQKTPENELRKAKRRLNDYT